MDKLDYGYGLILMYLVGGLAGNIYETCLYLVKRRKFVYSNGSVTTPFNFVYGIGAVAICLGLISLKDDPFWVFAVGALLGGAVEYAISFAEEKILHTRSWNYNYMKFNINGRTALLPMIVWGLLSMLVLYCVYLPIDNFIVQRFFTDTAAHARVYHTVLTIIIIYCATDLAFTVTTVLRYRQRKDGVAATNGYARFLDKVFNDAYMQKHFENTKFDQPEKEINAEFEKTAA